jgi:drug/metabolite transporter (DMT)-like permease
MNWSSITHTSLKNKMIKTLFKNHPWIMFLLLGLIAQQGNMLSYKLSNEYTVPFAFLTYSFLFSAILNLLFIFYYKSRFPVQIDKVMIRNIVLVTVIYMVNEFLFVSIYRAGAPYALATAVFSVASLVILTLAGVTLLKEKLNRLQIGGIVLAMMAIVMIKVG